jgi:hypothetical protein
MSNEAFRLGVDHKYFLSAFGDQSQRAKYVPTVRTGSFEPLPDQFHHRRAIP